MIIMPAQMKNPRTPATSKDHLPHPRKVLAISSIPGGAIGTGFGALGGDDGSGAARRFRSIDCSVRWVARVVEPFERTVSRTGCRNG
ncbi:hypothetical protein GCM10009557_02880 [Virgisporangium ochraceum]|uniref:Uncharacterized protein n=1 Tax=Virgisporangium ochraceum TaxID=65505 RepID=A0A8J3ZQK4_9ACTN|nr:hypothetical protein Voc01_028680 [Virgisporangium ochraceum]